MKKTVLNLLIVFCLMSSMPMNTQQDMEGGAVLLFGGLAVGGAVVVGLVGGAVSSVHLALIKRKWGSLDVGVPAVAFQVPYTKGNKELLEAAKNKNDVFIREKLRALNQDAFGPVNNKKIIKLLNTLEQNRQKLRRATEFSPRETKEILEVAKASKFLSKYVPVIDKWVTLRNLYGALDTIYNDKGKYKRYYGLSFVKPSEFIAIKEKFDKQLGILD